jgi:UDP-galactopyranose mutase
VNSLYDFLIIGSGLFGSVFAHQATAAGKKCLILEKRSHVGGNIFCENIEGINVHKYGPHIFHTNNKEIWDFVNTFVEFNRFTYSPIANYNDQLYNLPFNMNTFFQMWGLSDPSDVKKEIERQVRDFGVAKPTNLEEQAISMVGVDIYEKLIKGYTEKQWGRSAKELPSFIIRRLPVRLTFDNNYFNDKYQGIPIGGYNPLIEGLIGDVEVILGEDYLKNKEVWNNKAKHVVYTGAIDELFDHCFGQLDYRSLRFETEVLDKNNQQGVAVVNYTDSVTPFTRIIEHKHFEFGKQEKTVLTKEFPQKWDSSKEKYYPINDDTNNMLFKKYRELAKLEKKLILGGRLAEYKYYDMHQVIGSALSKSRELLNE